MANGGYVNPYFLGQVYPAGYNSGSSFPSYGFPQNFAAQAQPQIQPQQYMISVDGEGAAKAWQIPGNPVPNLVIPLWDLDGKHVYFKSTDAYGRMNPLKKGVIIFEEDSANMISTDTAPKEQYVTKEDFEKLKNEIKGMINQPRNRGDQK